MNQVVLLLLVTSVVTTLCAHIPVKGGGRLPAKDEDVTQNKSGLGSFESRLKDQEATRLEERTHRNATISADGQSEREVKEETQRSTNTHEENHHSKTLGGEKHVYKKTTENQSQNKVAVREQTSSEGDASLTSPKQVALEDDRKVHSTDGAHTHTILDDQINDKKVNLEETRHVVHDSQAHHSYPDNIHHNEQKTVITQDVIDHEQDSHRHHQLNINVHGSGNQQKNQKGDGTNAPVIPSFGGNFEDAGAVSSLPKPEGALKIDNVGEEKFEGITHQKPSLQDDKGERKHHDLPKDAHHAHHERHWDHDYDYDRHPIDHHHHYHHEGPVHKHIPTPAPKIEEKKEVIKTDDTRVIEEESGKKDETVLELETNTGSAKREEQEEAKVEVAVVAKEETSTEGSSVISKDVTTHHYDEHVHEHHPHHGHGHYDHHEEKYDHHHKPPTTLKPIIVKDEEGAKIDIADTKLDSGLNLSSDFGSKREEKTKVVIAEDKSSAGSTGVSAEVPKKNVHHPVKGGHPHHHSPHWEHHEHDYDDDDDSHEYHHHHEKFHHRPDYHHPHHHVYDHGSPYHSYWTDF